MIKRARWQGSKARQALSLWQKEESANVAEEIFFFFNLGKYDFHLNKYITLFNLVQPREVQILDRDKRQGSKTGQALSVVVWLNEGLTN